MVKLLGSIVGRTCKAIDNYIHARRHGVRLPLSVSLLDSRPKANSAHFSPSMSGYLRDISKTGLSLIVPSMRFGNYFLISGHYPLHVSVELPNRVVNIHIAPVRYDKLFGEQSERKYLIGARIMQMTDSDREHLIQYIEQMKKSRAASFSLARDVKSA